jgi:pyruvate dehydrogenase (quinone)
MAPRIPEMAMCAAVEENGVAVVVVPGEIFLQRADASGFQSRPVVATRSVVRPDDESLRRAAEILNAAEAITILGGAGVAGSHDALIQLAATLNAPIVHALRGKEFIEYDNPFDVGMTGLLGFASGYKAIKEADALLMLGTDFPYQQFYPDNAKVIQVDIRGRNLGRRTPIDLGLVGTVEDTLAALQPLLRQKDRRDHLDRALRHYGKTRKSLDELATNDRDRTPIRPEYVAGLTNQLATDDAVFTVDVGSPVVWAARYLRMNGRRRLIGSFNHGTMACATAGAGRCVRIRRTGPRRRGDRPPGTVDTAGDHRRTGQRLLPVRDPDHPGRPRRRASRLDHHQRRATNSRLRRLTFSTFSANSDLGR